MSRTILIMAGGTGGHIMPGLAVADILRTQGWNITWMGVPGSMEAELVPKQGYPMTWVNFSGVRGKGILRKLALPFNLLIAMWQSLTALLRIRPDVVLGLGGYITFPGGLMAALMRRPLVIHEQNSVAGLSNRILAKLAQRVLSGFPDVLPKALWCGNPVRSNIADLTEPRVRYATRNGTLKILVVGGSLGAKVLNEVLPQAIARLPVNSRPEIIHQTGKSNFDSVKESYKKSDVKADVRPFLDDMAGSYAQADLVICRAGALTVAELASAGLASLLVPFPYAVDDHQTGNARFLSDRGAAWLMPQSEFNPDTLAQLLIDLTAKPGGREKLMTMAIAARNLAKSDAAQQVAQICVELAEI
jgi:UDP-N-acetylglucosamine--N-acetylmuramyl-(pentapeptide) pyrophosphoryl-undecaprenol N-acetylglucosamine transferase